MGRDERPEEARYVVWKPEMSVRSSAIDVQHRQVIGLLNECYGACRTDNPPCDFDALLFRLRIFTETHFAYEEAVLQFTGYPHLDTHKALHRAMVGKTKEVILDLSSSHDYPTLLRFLRDWWLDHIQGIDREYIPYVEKLGL